MEDEELTSYRNHIAEAGEKAQENFDKTVLALSGGALGVSLTFVEKFVGTRKILSPSELYWAWILWSVSLLLVLVSYFSSVRALRHTSKASYTGKVYNQRPGGAWSIATEWLNIAGAVCFIAGLALLISFVGRNLPH